jgi:hypothetical protein
LVKVRNADRFGKAHLFLLRSFDTLHAPIQDVIAPPPWALVRIVFSEL